VYKKNNSKGILFWVTGLAGSGKSTYAKLLKPFISKKFGPTIMLSGDDLRKIFGLKGYSFSERKNIVKKYCSFLKFVTDQKINVIFAVIGMMEDIRKNNRKIFKNYVEIYVKSNLKNLKKKNKKNLYSGKKKNVVGVDIKADLPKKPTITFVNNFKKNKKKQAKEIYFKMLKKI